MWGKGLGVAKPSWNWPRLDLCWSWNRKEAGRAQPLKEWHNHACMHVQLLQLCPTVSLWTVSCQAPLSTRFSGQEYWSGWPCPPSGDLPDPGIDPMLPVSPASLADSLPLSQWVAIEHDKNWLEPTRSKMVKDLISSGHWASYTHSNTLA